jgi:hypothetical protein
MGYRGREVDGIRILYHGKPKRMSKAEKRFDLSHRQWNRASDICKPTIGYAGTSSRVPWVMP